MKKSTTSILFFAVIISSAALVNAQTTILSTDFESGLPAGWSQTTLADDGGWLFGINTDLQSAAFSIPAHTKMACSNDDACNCDKSSDILITPSMDFTGYQFIFLSFDSYFAHGYYDSQEETYIKVSTDGGNTWTTVYSLPGAYDWNTIYVDLSSYVGLSNVKLAIQYDDGGGWGYGSAVDNFKVYAPVPGADVSVQSVIAGKIDPTPTFVGFPTYIVDAPLSINCSLKNTGTTTINSFDLSWTDGVNIHNESFSGLSIAPLSSYSITCGTQYVTLSGNHSIDLTVSNVNNGAVEIDATNNAGSYSVNGVKMNPDKKYLAEEATGTWCGWCVRGIVFMDYMSEIYPDQFVGIAVHNSDPMTNSDYDGGIGSFPGFLGYPSVVIDRNYIVDPSELEVDFINNLTQAPAVIVSADAKFNPTNNELTVVAKGDFLSSLSGDYRFNVVIVEDSVHGTSSGYKQTNYYSGGGYGPMGGFEDLGSPVPAASMYYDHVGRELLGGFDGQSGSLPSSITPGDSYSYTFTYTVPSNINVNHMHVAVMVMQYGGEVLNANNADWEFTSGINSIPANASVYVYPNPANDFSTLDIKLANTNDVNVLITNMIGQVVYANSYSSLSNEQLLSIPTNNFSNGLYTIKISVADQTITRELVVSH